jgi:hypothetical protein
MHGRCIQRGAEIPQFQFALRRRVRDLSLIPRKMFPDS